MKSVLQGSVGITCSHDRSPQAKKRVNPIISEYSSSDANAKCFAADNGLPHYDTIGAEGILQIDLICHYVKNPHHFMGKNSKPLEIKSRAGSMPNSLLPIVKYGNLQSWKTGGSKSSGNPGGYFHHTLNSTSCSWNEIYLRADIARVLKNHRTGKVFQLIT